MNKFRISQSPSAEEREILTHLMRAAREIEAAVAIVSNVKMKGNPRARRVEGDLRKLLWEMDEVSSLSSKYGEKPSDLEASERRAREWRERKAEEKRLEAEKRAAQEEGDS